MQILKNQNVKATITETSVYGAKSDLVHVDMLIETNEPIPADKYWYVPNGSSIPPVVQDVFKTSNINMYPMSEEKLLQGTEDIKAAAENGDLNNVIQDSAKFMMMAILKKVALVPVPDTINTYILSYDYKIFKNSNNAFEFRIVLPFDGLELVPGGRVQLTVVMPTSACIDTNATKGIAQDGQEITECIIRTEATSQQIVSFAYQNDPEFIIQYMY